MNTTPLTITLPKVRLTFGTIFTPATNVMIDIETYGNTPGSVIKSLGAVKFALEGGIPVIQSRFYQRIDPQTCIAVGLTIDPSTVEWWLNQPDQARKEMTLPGQPLMDVLNAFKIWVNDDNAEVWGNGATYDNVLVACAAKAVGVYMAWVHFKSRCYRTIKNANKDLPIDAFKVGTHHNALDDAESQALHLMAIWQRDAKRNRVIKLLRDEMEMGNLERLVTTASKHDQTVCPQAWYALIKEFQELLS